MTRIVFAWLWILGLLSASAGVAAERLAYWPHWRGPEATGVAPQGKPPVHWDEQTHVQWKVELPGRGSSTPIIWGDRVFLLTAVDTGREVPSAPQYPAGRPNPFGIKYPTTLHRFVVLCLDRTTGRTLWEQTAVEALPNEGHHHDNSYASSSPTTDGHFLYVAFGSQGIYCYDLNGQLQWKQALQPVTTRLSFGEASSPVVHDQWLVLNRDNEGKSQILALNARTGTLQWSKDRDEVSAWATPLIVEHAGRTQVITNASKRVRSYELTTGEVLWECGGQVGNVTPSPVRFQDLVICMSGYQGSAALALPLDAEGDITGTDKIVWTYPRDTPYVPSPVLYENLLYFNKSNSGVVTCLDAGTGKPLAQAQRLSDLNNMYASPVAAANHVYFVGRDGTTVVCEHGPELKVVATNKLNEPIDASPAIAGNQLFLRGRKFLYCLAQP